MDATAATSPGPAPLTPAAVVACFDELLAEGLDLVTLLDRAAAALGAAVGYATAAGGGGSSPVEAASRPAAAASASLGGHDGPGLGAEEHGGEAGGEVWTTLADPQLTPVVLERLGVAVRVTQRWAARREAAAPPPIDVLLDRASPQGARDRALDALGLAQDAPVRFVVCTGPAEGIETLLAGLAGQRVLARTTHDGRTVLMLAAPDPAGIELPGVPVGVRAAYSHVVAARQASVGFMNACDMQRFSRPSPADQGPYRAIDAVWLNGARTAPLGALAHLDPEYLATLPDVQKLERLAERHGERILQVLEAYATTESMRKAAALVFMHHNSVLYWVQKAEAELGYSLAGPYQRALLFLSLCLHRIWRNQD
ncbi:MAG TPA: helix-turn-helix domain-containing protein [Microbacteriaceae bacterium]|nr:helix-turn-helix domain-containing protein [Microbacteriaceae bacterium]